MPTMTKYNLSGYNTTDGNMFINFIHFTSSSTNYIGGWVIYCTLFMIILLGLIFKGNQFSQSFAVTAFFMFIIALMLYPLQIISGYLLAIAILLVPISVFVLFVSE